MSRRLPVYLLVDSSGSMNGEPIHSVNEGLRALLYALRQDPYALETVHLSIITFDREIKEILPLTPIEEAQVHDIAPPPSGATHMGEALDFLIERYRRDVVLTNEHTKADFAPMLFVMTDGKPSDLQRFEEAAAVLAGLRFAAVIGCAAGPKARTDYLARFCDPVIALETTDSSSFTAFFKWVSASITAGSRSGGLGAAGASQLPPPPAEVNLVY